MPHLRSRLDIISDMLFALVNKGGALKPTHLMYKANLSYNQMQGYLKELEKNSHIIRERSSRGNMIRITDEGTKFANKLREMREFSEMFRI